MLADLPSCEGIIIIIMRQTLLEGSMIYNFRVGMAIRVESIVFFRPSRYPRVASTLNPSRLERLVVNGDCFTLVIMCTSMVM